MPNRDMLKQRGSIFATSLCFIIGFFTSQTDQRCAQFRHKCSRTHNNSNKPIDRRGTTFSVLERAAGAAQRGGESVGQRRGRVAARPKQHRKRAGR